MSRVFVVGSINDDIVVGTDRHPNPGETVRGSTLKHFQGGKGANQAVGASRAGAEVWMIGCTGADEAGRLLTENLREAGIDCSYVREVDSEPTGTALITVAGGENTIVVVSGANGELDASMLADVPFGRDDIVVAQFETPVATTIAAFRRAGSAGALTVLNPAPAAEVPVELLGITDVLIVNEHEFATIFGHSTVPILAGDCLRPPIVDERYSGTLVVTFGKDGFVAWPSDQGTLREPGVPVHAVDSTGAGDCFVGYLVAELLHHQGLGRALRVANQAAALSVTRPGAGSSIPFRHEVSR